MALFTDGTVSSIDDLSAQDAQVLEMASLEGIDLTRKMALARDEMAMELEALLPRASYEQNWLSGQLDLGRIIVTPPLKLWHAFRTLELVYRDAYNSQLNDRYAGKQRQYRELGRWAFDRLIQTGIGVAADPMPQASMPVLKLVNGSLADGTYYVSASWLNHAGGEGASSNPADIAITTATFQACLSQGPKAASGWNLYAGTRPDLLVRQNNEPIGMDEAWIQPDVLSTDGPTAGTGQAPDYIRAVPRMIKRG